MGHGWHFQAAVEDFSTRWELRPQETVSRWKVVHMEAHWVFWNTCSPPCSLGGLYAPDSYRMTFSSVCCNDFPAQMNIYSTVFDPPTWHISPEGKCPPPKPDNEQMRTGRWRSMSTISVFVRLLIFANHKIESDELI